MKIKTVIGTEYYRPPNPEISDFEKDIEKIKKAGLNVIRTWLHWQQVNPEDGKWDFGSYDKLFKYARKNDVKVLIQINVEIPPEYIIKKFPNCLWINSKGEKVYPSSVPMAQLGTYPGVCPDCKEIKGKIEEFLKRVVLHYKDNSALFGYDVWNEFMPFYGFSSVFDYLYHPETKKKFYKFLKEKYKKIEKLNFLYGGRNYKNFNEVVMPSSGVFLEMLDLFEFSSEWIFDYLKWKKETVRKYDKKHPICAHAGSGVAALLLEPFDVWKIAEIVDIWGTSCYEINFWKIALQCLITDGSSQGKNWGIVEMSGGRTYHGPYGSYLRTPEFLEQLILLSISYGGKFNLFWQWRPERFGQESPNFGLVNEDGSFNKRTERISNLAKIISKKQKIFDNFKFPESDVALLIDWRTILIEHISSPIASEEERFTITEILGWFYALSKAGANFKIISGSEVVKKGIPSEIKLLIAPLLTIERDKIVDRIVDFVERGGHFLAGPYFFIYDRFTYMNKITPPEKLQKIFGSKRKEIYYSKNILLENPKVINKINGFHCFEVYECQNSHPYLTTGKFITGTKNIYRNSLCYRVGSLCGSYIGKKLMKGEKIEDEGLVALCEKVMSETDISTLPVSSTGDVLLRIAFYKKEAFVFVHNPSDNPQDIFLSFDFSIKKAYEVLSDENLKIFDKNKLFISLKGRETKILEVKQ
ncbi:beta-galactosidase [Candidatus Calescamantes bacterium]|nr:beta-galactosidase [Candidatus Calescamantes bacterium]